MSTQQEILSKKLPLGGQVAYRAALFDLDGVVFDTEPQYTVFWGGVMRKFRPDVPGLEYTIKGSTLTRIFEDFLPHVPEEYENIVKGLDEFERNMDYPFVEGFEDFVNHPTRQRWTA